MKILLTSITILISTSILSQYKYNNDYDYNRFEKTWEISTKIVNNQIIFNWEKDIVTSIIIKSLDADFSFPKIDAFMTSQLTLNSLNKGKYEVVFLDDCNAIMDKKQFEIE